MRTLSYVLALGIAGLAVWACGAPADEPEAPSERLDRQMDDLRARYGLTSIAAVVVKDGEVVVSDAWGVAHVADDRAADARTIYALASVSKPFVGLAIASAIEAQPDLDLDTDINAILDWDPPLRHPRFPDTPITLRHLVSHHAGLVADGPADYDTYPKPDPEVPLEDFLEDLLSDEAYWLPTAPGAAEEYSNLGVALAALVVEVASGEDFRAFTQRRIFDPLGMDDTRWFFGDLSASQQARHAIPYAEDGAPYEIYGFNDYPSGQLRTTADDMGKFLIMLTNQDDAPLSAASLRLFEDTPLLIEAGFEGEGRAFEHSGGEAGVSTYLTYGDDGVGFAWMINTDVADAADDALFDELTAVLRAEATR